MNRWNKLGYEMVVGIDLDPDSIRQATERYTESKYNKNKFKVLYVCGDLTKLIYPDYDCAYLDGDYKVNMKMALPTKYMFDVVSSQFMIHYSFSTELNVKIYFQNVVDNLKIGGYFVGTTFDGQRLYNDLQENKVLSGSIDNDKIWEITKLYGTKKFNPDKPSTGLKINVFVKSIGIAHPEYLVNYKYLIAIAEDFGLKLIEIKPFSEYWDEVKQSKNTSNDIKNMTDAEKQFSFYFSSFIFEKVKDVSQANTNKLYKLAKKQK
jgi:mRNA (guanine-N7-)-methyltransferase